MAKLSNTNGGLSIVLSGVRSNTTETIPAGYAIRDVFVQETAGAAVTGGIKIGTTSGGTEIATAIAVGVNSYTRTQIAALNNSGPFSATLDKTIYIQAASAWNGANIKLVIPLTLAEVFTPIPTPNTFLALVGDGDSITAGGYGAPSVTSWLTQQVTSTIHVTNEAASASTVATLVSRGSTVDNLATSGSALVVLIGANDLRAETAVQFTDALASYLDARLSVVPTRIIICCTVLPSTFTPDFNTKRNDANTTIKSWLGTRCSYLIDFAADSTIGTDAAASNATYYLDGVHPTQAGADIMAGIAASVLATVPYN